jgi:hypothetical protein
MRLKLISCEIFYREMCAVVARSPNMVDVEFLPKGLHDAGSPVMLARLQAAVDAVEAERYEAVLLGYGLCGTGIVGLTARGIPIVIPRAHDCITHFLGSKERYADYFQNYPGVYFKTTGWIERGQNLEQLTQQSLRKSGLGYTYAELVEKYGEDNAKFLFEQLGDTTRNYHQFTFIEMGIEPDDRFERASREEAARRGWTFDKIQGDMGLIERLVNGPWNDTEFLVVAPGFRVVARYDESVMSTEPVK